MPAVAREVEADRVYVAGDLELADVPAPQVHEPWTVSDDGLFGEEAAPRPRCRPSTPPDRSAPPWTSASVSRTS